MIPTDSQLHLRFTPESTASPSTTAWRTFHPVRLFVDMNLAAKFWFALFLFTLLTLLAQSWWASHRPQERVVVIDSAGSAISAPLLDFQQATNLHLQQAKLATHAFLSRHPLDFDQPELFRLMFLSDAWTKARRQFDEEAGEREGRQWHQKPEIARIDLLETRHDQILIQVSGQLVRSGVFQERTFAETVPFRLSLKMLRNPDLTLNGRFPTAVQDFRLRYETSH
jgi:hypothetical protein